MFSRTKKVSEILEERGYTQVRPSDTREWRPLRVIDEYGTTDNIQVRKADAAGSKLHLICEKSGNVIAVARKNQS